MSVPGIGSAPSIIDSGDQTDQHILKNVHSDGPFSIGIDAGQSIVRHSSHHQFGLTCRNDLIVQKILKIYFRLLLRKVLAKRIDRVHQIIGERPVLDSGYANLSSPAPSAFHNETLAIRESRGQMYVIWFGTQFIL